MVETNGYKESFTNGDHAPSSADFSTDFLIVGTGPAGSALACFLASYGKNNCGLAFVMFATDGSTDDDVQAYVA